MKVLVHYDKRATRPHGIWWEDQDGPRCLYANPGGPWEARGRMIVFNTEGPEISWGERFDELTARAPYTETWVTYDSMGMTPSQLLAALQPSEPLVS